MTLNTITGNLKAYSQLEPGTMLHADQLMAEQITNASLRNNFFYLADGLLYSLEGESKTPTVWITREEQNLVLRHLFDEENSSYDQLIQTGNYHPNVEEARTAMNAESTIRIDLTKLRLEDEDILRSYLSISTTKYDNLNQEELKLAERFYGQEKQFVTAMARLHDAGIIHTRVCILGPDYVEKAAAKSPLGRASWRSAVYSSHYTNVRSIDNNFYLRGVPLLMNLRNEHV